MPLSLSLEGVPLFDRLSDGEADVVPEDDDEGAEVLGDMLLELLDVLPDGAVLEAFDDELDVSVDDVAGDVVDGLIVLLLEVEDGAVPGVVVVDELEVDGVVDGVVVVDDVLLVSR